MTSKFEKLSTKNGTELIVYQLGEVKNLIENMSIKVDNNYEKTDKRITDYQEKTDRRLFDLEKRCRIPKTCVTLQEDHRNAIH